MNFQFFLKFIMPCSVITFSSYIGDKFKSYEKFKIHVTCFKIYFMLSKY